MTIYPILTLSELDAIWRVSVNIEDEKKSKAVDTAQDIKLREVYGADLYNEIQTQLEADTVTAENKLLIDNSKRFVSFWAEFYIQDVIFANAYNKGHLTPSAEYGNSSAREDVKLQKQSASHLADEYAKRLYEFLRENKDTYPLWVDTCGTNGSENLGFSGLIFPSGENKESRRVLNNSTDNI